MGVARSAVRAARRVDGDVARAGKRRPPRAGGLDLSLPDSVGMVIFVVHDARNGGLDAGMETPSPKHATEFKRRAVELLSAEGNASKRVVSTVR